MESDILYYKILDITQRFYDESKLVEMPDYYESERSLIDMTEEEREAAKRRWRMDYSYTHTMNVLKVADSLYNDITIDPEEPEQTVIFSDTTQKNSCAVMELNKDGFCTNCNKHYEDHAK